MKEISRQHRVPNEIVLDKDPRFTSNFRKGFFKRFGTNLNINTMYHPESNRDFKVGEHVFIKVKEQRSLIRLGCCRKLVAKYCGPFEILEMIGPVAYILAFPA
jgi:hypothetical protein